MYPFIDLSSQSGVGRWTWKSIALTAGPMIVVMQATLLVLAGGESRRMGRTKAWLEVGETTLVRWVAERLAPGFSEVVVSFAEPEQVEQLLPYRIVFDRKPSAGPLAGLEAGLITARNEITFAVACDMPYVTREVAEMAVVATRSCDAAIPKIGGRPEPACAAYRRSAVGAIIERSLPSTGGCLVKIVVTVKQVPDPNSATVLEADNTLSRDKEVVLDPGDECGIEEALQLKEAHGGEVVLVSMGPERARDAIRKGLSMGADRGVLISDPQLAGADALLTARALAAAIKL